MTEETNVLSQIQDIMLTFADVKNMEKLTKKEVTTLGSRLKDLLKKAELSTVTYKDVTIKYSEVETPSFNEDLLIPVLRETGIKGIIKRKEYVDMQALEDAIYKGRLDPKLLSKCQVIKVSERLTVTDKRDKKEEAL